MPEKIIACEPYKKKFNFILGKYDLNDIALFNLRSCEKAHSKKRELVCYKCFHTCCKTQEDRERGYCQLYKFWRFNSSCPYISSSFIIKQPNKNSKQLSEWEEFSGRQTLRYRLKDYAQYVLDNKDHIVDIDLFHILEKIPEFSIQNLFNSSLSYEEFEDKLEKNINWPIKKWPRLVLPFYCNFLVSLKELYLQKMHNYYDGLKCRIFLDEEEANYLKWKDQQDEPAFIKVGNYFIFPHYLYAYDDLPTYIKRRTENEYYSLPIKYISDFKDYLIKHPNALLDSRLQRFIIEWLNDYENK